MNARDRPAGQATDPAARSPLRFPLMALGVLALLAGLLGGLARLGWAVPVPRPALPGAHGPLMIGGFLGTVIGLERAVALGRRLAYAGPALTGLGGLALLLGGPAPAGAALMALGSLALVLVFVVLLRRHAALYTATMAAGAAAWLAGNVLWLAGVPLHRVVPWWAGFLVLTIAGERLELSRLLRLSPASRAAFVLAAGLFLAGVAAGTVAPDAGVRVAGGGLVVLALWLGRHDVARRTVRQAGLTRFIAVCLLSGYAWLAAAGLLALATGGTGAGGGYDAWLHALFLGFVFAMIFGHAPIVFPAVLGVPMAFRPAFYAHLGLLHATLLVRLAGDLGGSSLARLLGGLGNVLALLLFLAGTATGVLAARRRPPASG